MGIGLTVLVFASGLHLVYNSCRTEVVSIDVGDLAVALNFQSEAFWFLWRARILVIGLSERWPVNEINR